MTDIDKVAEAVCNAYYNDEKAWKFNFGSRESWLAAAQAAIAAVFKNVTRIDMIESPTTSIRTTWWADSWELSLQDDGRTVKLFAEGDGRTAKAEQIEALASSLRATTKDGIN